MQIKYFAIVPAHGTSPTYNGNNSENQTKKQANKTNAPHPQLVSLFFLAWQDVTEMLLTKFPLFAHPLCVLISLEENVHAYFP